jgi:hypothetical protein
MLIIIDVSSVAAAPLRRIIPPLHSMMISSHRRPIILEDLAFSILKIGASMLVEEMMRMP